MTGVEMLFLIVGIILGSFIGTYAAQWGYDLMAERAYQRRVREHRQQHEDV